MSINQLHGKTVEDHLKSAFPGSADHERKPNDSWDIEKIFDDIDGLPTSIKTTKTNIVCLADARKFVNIIEPYRILIGRYKQINDVKHLYQIEEYLVTIDEHKKLLGDLLPVEVEIFHNSLLKYKLGEHKEARIFAKSMKKSLPNSIIQLNPKIDSKKQRRLQCSIKIEDLSNNVKIKNTYKDFYKKIGVEFKIKSDSREFNI